MCNKCNFIKAVIEAGLDNDIDSQELPMVLLDIIKIGSKGEIAGMLVEVSTGEVAMAERELLEPNTVAMLIADLTAKSNEHSKGELDSQSNIAHLPIGRKFDA